VLGADEAADIQEVRAWAAGLETLHARIAGRFARAEPRRRVLAYLRGVDDRLLLAGGRRRGHRVTSLVNSVARTSRSLERRSTRGRPVRSWFRS
jgi:hypothetical protein